MSGGGRKQKWKNFLKNIDENGSKVYSSVNVELKSSQSLNDSVKPRDTALAILNDGGEESVLLTADDWKKLTTRSTRASTRGTIGEPEVMFMVSFSIFRYHNNL